MQVKKKNPNVLKVTRKRHPNVRFFIGPVLNKNVSYPARITPADQKYRLNRNFGSREICILQLLSIILITRSPSGNE